MDLSFFVGYVVRVVGLGFLAYLIWPWASTASEALCFFFSKKLGEIRIIQAIDWLSNVSGQQVMNKNTKWTTKIGLFAGGFIVYFVVLNAIDYKQKNQIIRYKGQALYKLSSIHTTDTALDRQQSGKQKYKNRKNENKPSSLSQLGLALCRRADQFQYKIAFLSMSQSSVFLCNLYTSDYCSSYHDTSY